MQSDPMAHHGAKGAQGRMRRALHVLAFIVMVAWAGAARAADCARLDASPSASVDDDTAWAAAVFDAVATAEARVDPSATRPGLRILAPEAAPEAGAWYCRTSDVVFVSRPLVTYAVLARASDGADFLAFALAHELAHRRFDGAATPAPSLYAADPCAPGSGPDLEAAADRRAVFLMALARAPDGRRFTPFALAHYQSLTTFLATELGVPRDCAALAVRSDAVARGLGRLTEIAALYEAGLAVAFQPDGAADLTALTRALGTTGVWDAVPELAVLTAHAHIAAATRGGWCPDDLAAAGLVTCHETCAAIFPRHARLAPSPDPRTVPRSPTARAAALAAARLALNDARRQGLGAAELGGAEACLAFAERDPNRALAALATVPPHPTTAAARAANRQLFLRQRALLESPDPQSEPSPVDALVITSVEPVPADARDLAERVTQLSCDTTHACLRLPRLEVATLAVPRAAATSDTALSAWQVACELSRPGFADDGAALFVARCPRWDAGDVVGWTLLARGDRVVQATRVRRP